MPNCLLLELSAKGSNIGVWMRAPPAPHDTLLSGLLYSTLLEPNGDRALKAKPDTFTNVHPIK